MRLAADLHVHTTASGHGYSTVQECATTAAAKGLELIALLDHGPALPAGAHPYHFSNLKTLPSVLGGVRILKGIEANIIAEDGTLDLPDERLAPLDIVAVGLHPECGFDGAGEAACTRALLAAIANPLVDMVTHPGNGAFPVDAAALVEAALAHDVVLEVNDHTFAGSGSRRMWAERERAFAEAARDAGVKVAVGSDAHFHLHVGRLDTAAAVLDEIGLPRERVVSRDAATVLAHLTARRERPYLDAGGVW